MFLVLALPRSRTFWLSKFLSYGDHVCGHEESRHLRSIDDAKIWLGQKFNGSAETAIAPFWRLLHKANPDLRIVTVHRPVADAVESFMALDLCGIGDMDEARLTSRMLYLDHKLRQIAKRVPGVLSVEYDDLGDAETVKAVFEHCLPYRFDEAWWRQLQPQNLQCNMRDLTRYMLAYRESLDKMTKMATALSRAQLFARPPLSSEGVTFQQESFAEWVRDGVPLFEQHLVEVGEAPDNWRNKNLPLMQMMHEAGYFHITTARANGRMFGYLAAVMNPSLEVCDMLSGLHHTFYVSRDMPGIGLKLQRASVAALKEKGAREIVFFEGTRGSGPRLGTLYRRMGAQESGKLYRLDLGG
jgi:hypothetical protein